MLYSLVLVGGKILTPLPQAGTSIVVKVNNLCPADGNPLCSQSSLTAQNSLGELYEP